MAVSKKSIVIPLVLILAGTSIAGCSIGGQRNKQDVATKDGDNQGKAGKFKILFDYNIDPNGLNLLDNKYTQFLKEKTGVDVGLDYPGTAGYLDKLNIRMASGNYPDGASIQDTNRIKQFARDGILEDLTPYIKDKGKYPNFKNIPDSAFYPVTDNGKLWAFPANRADAFHQVVYIRKDWLQKLNLQVPITLNEYYDVLKAFTEKDPDGNGKNDTFGLLSGNNLNSGARAIFAAYDAERYRLVDGKVTPPEITDSYKESVRYLSRLAASNILDKEFSTSTNDIFNQKLKSLKYGMFVGFWHYASGKQFAKEVMDNYQAIEMPTMPDAKPSKTFYTSTNRHYVIIPKTTKNIDQLMKFFDWVLSPEGTKFTYLGIENQEYKMNGEKIEIIKEPQFEHWWFGLVKHSQLNDDVKKYYEATFAPAVVNNLYMSTKAGQMDNIQSTMPLYPDITILKKITDEFVVKTVVNGGADFDKAWNEYISKWKTAGGDKAIDFWTDWYNKEGKNFDK